MKLIASSTSARFDPCSVSRFIQTVNGRSSTFAIVGLLLLALSTAGMCQRIKQEPLVPKPQPAPPPTVPATSHDLDPADIGTFLDGLMPLTLERDDIAGAVVSIVKDGKVIFAKGYGYADVKSKKPVSTTDTLFRPGSISKLFTWTAVMQLVQEGKLNLDTDVNEYLDFKIPAKFDKPITLRDIMTHSAGFGETAKDLFIPDVKDLEPLRTYLITHMPERIYPPGTTPAYSNYATTLAGYIVQRVSGKPFNDYVAENIFGPLKMDHTTFVQPLPDALKNLMSSGYSVASKDAKPYEIVQAFPAGSVATSAMDMTHFMIAHLQGGEFEGAHILRPETVQLMHNRQRAPGNSDALNGMCLGFYEETRNGHRIIGHAGDTAAFHSDLHLMPDANLGFFVSYNSPGKGTLSDRTALWQKFLDRYFPYQLPAAPTIGTAAEDAGKVAGQYMVSRRLQGNFLNAFGMLGETKVSALPDHTIAVEALHGYNSEPMKFVEIAPLVYQNVNGQEKLAFYRGYDGRMTFGIDFPFMVFQKVGFLDSKSFNLFLIIASLVVMALAVLFWPIAAMMRRHFGQKLVQTSLDHVLRLIARLTCVAGLAVFGGMALVISKLGEPSVHSESLDTWIHLMQIFGVLAIIGSLAAAYYAVRWWRITTVSSPPIENHTDATDEEFETDGTRLAVTAGSRAATVTAVAAPSPARNLTRNAANPERKPWVWGKLAWTAVALGCLGFSWFLLYWGVLNFNLNY